ncbi:MAG TPA: RNA degradosome polyphosphate kinase, partial [Bryobacteraceae bacterium]|nr:RNA degradosome polyphosphate kinase [Bryobacteraceae bacterium]
LIRREIQHQMNGEQGHLIFKMNSLSDPQVIGLLYEASQGGVKVELLVRGVCCLRPGIPGTSENITVTSIVGRFLEHSRIYYFRNGGDEEIYLGSADLMNRNLNRRVETLFPLEEPGLVDHVRNCILSIYLADNVKARRMSSDGSYKPIPSSGEPLNSQEWFLEQAKALKKTR